MVRPENLSGVQIQNQRVPDKKKRVQNWKSLGLYVTRQLLQNAV